MIVPSFARRLPRVLCVASSLLYKCNDAINTIGCKQSFSQPINTHQFCFPNPKVTGHIEPVRGLLQFPRQCWNLTSIRSYGGPRFSPEHLTEAQIIDAAKSGKHNMDDVVLCFSRKQLYKQKQLSPQFRRELGELFVKHYLSLDHVEPKVAKWLLNALANLKYPTDPSFIDLPLRSIQNGCKDKSLYSQFIQIAERLPLLNWSSIPPSEKLILICHLIMPMLSAAEDRNLTYLPHTWCKYTGWREIAREYLVTETYLKECQRRVPKIDVRHLNQLLEAISICLPLPGHDQLPLGWMEAVQKRLLSCDLSPSAGHAATLLDAFWQIQHTCSPSQHKLSIPVANRLFKIWFDPKQQCVGPNQTLTCLVLRAMGTVGIDPGRLDKRFWPWFWREIEQSSLNEWTNDSCAMVLDALYQLRIAVPSKCVQKIINTIRADNPMLAGKLLYSLARIKEHMPALIIREGTKRTLTKGYIDSLPDLPAKDLVLGAWSLPKIGFNPVKVDDRFWMKFYKHSECHMNKFTSHQQNMLLTILSHPSTELPTVELLEIFMAAIDRKPPDSTTDAALGLRHLMLLHQHLDDPASESKDLLHVVMENKDQRILKFYKHWLKGMDGLNTLNEILFPLDVMEYFDLRAKVGKSDIDEWCKCMEKYINAKWRAEDKRLFHKIVDAYKLPDSFHCKILKK